MPLTGPFDRHFREYEAWFGENRWVYESELRAVGHLLPRQGEGLEIGVGSGRFAGPLGIRIGVEPSPAMRKLARRRGIEVYDAPAESLPFAAGRFDFALMVTTICFLDDVGAAFREAGRVLTDGGALVIGFVDKDSALGTVYQKRKGQNLFYREATFYSAAEVSSLLQNHGFSKPRAIQTVFGALSRIHTVQDFKEGFGEGGFVVLRATKTP